MTAGELGYAFGAFCFSLGFAAAWLIICRIVPSLRRNISISYGVAVGIVALFFVLLSSKQGITWMAINGCGYAAIVLWLLYRRAKAKLAQPPTVP